MTILELINDIEKKYPVDTWVVKGYNVWPIIRIKLAIHYRIHLLKLKPDTIETLVLKNSPSTKIKDWIKKIVNWENRSFKHKFDRYRLKRRLKKKDTVAFFTFSTNRMLQDAVWHNRSVDPIVDILKDDLPVVLLEHKGVWNRYPRYNNKYCVEIDRIIETAHFRPVIKKHEIGLEGYSELLSNINQAFPVLKIDNVLSKEILIKTIQHFEAMVAFFSEVFKSSGIKVVLTTCYYDLRSMAIITACKRNKIPTVELPHGVHGKDHFAYGKWTKLPISGYEMLPDYFWCWSETEKEAINNWSKENFHQAFVGGNPWLHEWIGNIHPLSKRINNFMKAKWGESVKILLSLAPGNELKIAIPEIIIDAINQSPPDWIWLIRLHPRQPLTIDQIEKGISSYVPRERINVKEATEIPLPALLKVVNVHLTLNSSVIVEAATFGVPSVTFDEGFDMFNNLVPAHLLYKAEQSGKSIIEKLSQTLKQKQSEVVLGKSQKEYLAAINLILEKAGIDFRVK